MSPPEGPSDVDLNDVIKDCIKQRSNAVGMMNKMDFIDLLKLLTLDQENQTLIPLAIMKAKKKKMEQKQQKNLKKIKNKQNNPKNAYYEEAYLSLLQSSASETNQLKAAFNRFLLDQVSGLFEGSSQEPQEGRVFDIDDDIQADD